MYEHVFCLFNFHFKQYKIGFKIKVIQDIKRDAEQQQREIQTNI